MKILGIDPGLLKTGYALINFVDSEPRLEEYGCIKNHSKTSTKQRYLKIYNKISEVIINNHPDALAIEKVIYCNNSKVAIKLGEARGLALLTSFQNDIPLYEYAPKKIKQSVVGNGNASKAQVQWMISKLLKSDQTFETDVSDAVGAAICHYHTIKLRKITNK